MVRIKPNDKKHVVDEKTMNPAMLVTGKLELPTLAIGQFAFQTETILFCGIGPNMVMAPETNPMSGSNLTDRKLADFLEPIQELQKIGGRSFPVTEFAVAGL